jgi:hypothetical protein
MLLRKREVYISVTNADGVAEASSEKYTAGNLPSRLKQQIYNYL